MNKLVKALKDLTHTENMSLTYSDSGSDLLNLFALFPVICKANDQ